MNDVRKKILEIMSVIFELEVDEISNDAAPGLIENWDSLRHMTLIVALEEEYNIHFADDELIELLNLALIEAIVVQKLSSAAKS